MDQPRIPVPGYEYDVFISYAHVDNLTATGEPGWVDHFHKHLAVHLARRVGRADRVRIWRDEALTGNELFDDVIKNRITASAVFLALTSQGHLASDYCRQEVRWFYDKARREEIGLRVGERTRFFNVLLSNVSYEEWPEELGRTSGFPFHDARGRDKVGRPLDPEDPEFQNRLWKLADAIFKTLRDFPAASGEVPARETSSPPGQKPAAATPRYPSAKVRELSQELEDAYRQKEELVTAGGDTTAIGAKILALRRRLREGGQLKAGDFLDDGRFKLIEPIGRGGFATVWRAYDRKTKEPVAVKVLHGQFAEDRTRRERFFRGARKMAQLQHQGIVRVIEAEGEEGGYWFFVMEYVPGGDLRQAVLSGRLPPEERLRIILQVGAALEFAHRNGVIHRDVKPANVLLDRAGRPKLTDFDLVRALDTTGGTRTEGMIGTFLYAAPEAMQNPKETAATADVYSLGMTAVFALHGKELPITVMRDAESIIDNLSCSPQVKKVLVRAVDWDPGRRFSSVAALCSGLREPGPEEETDANGIVFVRIPAGTFTMGSADDDPMARDDEKPAHPVTLGEFWISKYPITNEQYHRLRPDSQEYQGEGGDLPVTGVSWHEATEFCERLGYRLPTEAEWEYAARAGTETPWSFGDDESEIGRYAWYTGNSGGRVHPVGTREPNPWGLYDMHGNVWEWVDDEYARYSPEPQTNPATPGDRRLRSFAVLRGGSAWVSPRFLRSADRYGGHPVDRVPVVGFRCVRGPRRRP